MQNEKMEQYKESFIQWCREQVGSNYDGSATDDSDKIAYRLSVEEMCRIAVYHKEQQRRAVVGILKQFAFFTELEKKEPVIYKEVLARLYHDEY